MAWPSSCTARFFAVECMVQTLLAGCSNCHGSEETKLGFEEGYREEDGEARAPNAKVSACIVQRPVTDIARRHATATGTLATLISSPLVSCRLYHDVAGLCSSWPRRKRSVAWRRLAE